jgi:hypothetical protein
MILYQQELMMLITGNCWDWVKDNNADCHLERSEKSSTLYM